MSESQQKRNRELLQQLQRANEKEEIASKAYAEEYTAHTSLKKAAKALLKWHDEELPKWNDFISANLIRQDLYTVEGAKPCKEEVDALRKALEDEK